MENLTNEEIQQLVARRFRQEEKIKQWKDAHLDRVRVYQNKYNAKYIASMKDQTVYCDCCCKDIKKISYYTHVKSKRHLTKLTTTE